MAYTRVLKNAVRLTRTEKRFALTVQRAILGMRSELVALIAQMPSADTIHRASAQRKIEQLLAKSDVIIKQAYQDLHLATAKDLIALAHEQGLTTTQVMMDLAKLSNSPNTATAFSLPSRASVRSLLTASPVQGKTMREWWGTQSASLRDRFQTQIRLGLINGESIGQMTARVIGGQGIEGTTMRGILRATVAQGEALVRTAVNEFANAAAQLTYEENKEVLVGFEYVATLDERTTDICRALDGKVFKIGDPKAKSPPQHWGCRSTTVPVLNYKKLNLNAPKESRTTFTKWYKERLASARAA